MKIGVLRTECHQLCMVVKVIQCSGTVEQVNRATVAVTQGNAHYPIERRQTGAGSDQQQRLLGLAG